MIPVIDSTPITTSLMLGYMVLSILSSCVATSKTHMLVDGDSEVAEGFIFVGNDVIFDKEDENLIEGVSGGEHHIFIPSGVRKVYDGKMSTTELSAKLELDKGAWSAGFAGRDEILSFNDVHVMLGEFGKEIDH